MQRIAYAAVKQQHANGDGGHSKPRLTRARNPHQPGSPPQCVIGPRQNEIDDLAPVDVYSAHRGDFLPRNAPGHQATIQDASVVDGEHNHCRIASSDQPMHQCGHAQQSGEKEPPPRWATEGKPNPSWQDQARQDQRCQTKLCHVPAKRNSLRCWSALRIAGGCRRTPSPYASWVANHTWRTMTAHVPAEISGGTWGAS